MVTRRQEEKHKNSYHYLRHEYLRKTLQSSSACALTRLKMWLNSVKKSLTSLKATRAIVPRECASVCICPINKTSSEPNKFIMETSHWSWDLKVRQNHPYPLSSYFLPASPLRRKILQSQHSPCLTIPCRTDPNVLEILLRTSPLNPHPSFVRQGVARHSKCWLCKILVIDWLLADTAFCLILKRPRLCEFEVTDWALSENSNFSCFQWTCPAEVLQLDKV